MPSAPTVICLTPVKNEAWILRRFLQCASMWADHIIIADQGSDDGSRDIARSFPKVQLVDNDSVGLDENYRGRLLLDAARKIPGPRLLISLDADEILTANFATSQEWNTVRQAAPGTVIRFRWPIINSDFRTYWSSPAHQTLGLMDDGRPFTGKKIHGFRLPVAGANPSIILNDVCVMHYVGTDATRWDHKHRWYHCWERLNRPERRPIENYRFYHRREVVPASEIKMIPRDEWFSGYEKQGIDMTSVIREPHFPIDAEVLGWFQRYGTSHFRKEAIWDVDWNHLYTEIYGQNPPVAMNDPRSLLDRIVHHWLAGTQHHFSYYPVRQGLLSKLRIRLIEKLLRPFGW
jgi:glycosyltransferase involved in cell wall biosynthesis